MLMRAPVPKATFFGYARTTSTIGARASVCVSLTCEKMGDSVILRRMYNPTTMSKKLRRNGTRQPQDRNCSSGRAAKGVNAAVESTSPAGAPICGQLPKNPRVSEGECSTAIKTAPPHSPPTAKPCKSRSTVDEVIVPLEGCAHEASDRHLLNGRLCPYVFPTNSFHNLYSSSRLLPSTADASRRRAVSSPISVSPMIAGGATTMGAPQCPLVPDTPTTRDSERPP